MAVGSLQADEDAVAVRILDIDDRSELARRDGLADAQLAAAPAPPLVGRCMRPSDPIVRTFEMRPRASYPGHLCTLVILTLLNEPVPRLEHGSQMTCVPSAERMPCLTISVNA